MHTITVKGENITLDLLLYRLHKTTGNGIVERALELNPDIADVGAILPIGTVVTLPDPVPVPTTKKLITLFD